MTYVFLETIRPYFFKIIDYKPKWGIYEAHSILYSWIFFIFLSGILITGFLKEGREKKVFYVFCLLFLLFVAVEANFKFSYIYLYCMILGATSFSIGLFLSTKAAGLARHY